MNHKMETEQEPLEPTPVPKTNFSSESELQEYKLKYDALFLEFEQEFHDPLILDYFVLSKNFLKEWNEFIGYETGKPELSKPPGEFNCDLIESLKETKKYWKSSSQPILRKGLQSKMDYEIVNQKLMDFFQRDFKGVVIPRKAFIQPDGHKFVEVYPKEINAVFLTHTILVEMDKKQRHDLTVQKIECFSQSTIQEFKEHLVKSIGKKDYGTENIRLWKISHEIEKFFKETQKICNDTRSFDYEIPIKGIFLDKNPEVKLEDFGFSETDHLVVELRESHKNWNFVQEGIPTMKKCGFCSKFTDTVIWCSCKKLGYCCKECKFKDKRYHKRYCDSANESDDDEDDEFQVSERSRMGITGLHNLGNTCFMNSALQCMSNTFGLTKYFIEKSYLADINTTNILGSKGKLAREYANLLINLWLSQSDTFSPYVIKSRVSDRNQMFCGYNQHDSQEFLLYLLDGLHEDLNRIKDKPYVKEVEYPPGTSELTMAGESWTNYLKRNSSIITDFFMGQYKSVITCPTCNKISKTFDPFLSWSVPISSKKKKFLEFKFIPGELSKIPNTIKLEITSDIVEISQLRRLIADQLGVDPQTFSTFSFYYISRSIDKVNEEKVNVKEMRKKVKRSSYYELYLVGKTEEEQKIEDLVEIHASFTHEEETTWSSAYKRTFFLRPFYFSAKDSAKDIHLKVFKHLRYFFENSNKQIEQIDLEEESPIKNLPDEEALKQINEDNACYTLFWSPNYRGYDPCEFCGKKYCQGCKIEYSTDIILQDLLKKCKSTSYSSNSNLEIEIFWKPKRSFGKSLQKMMNNFQPPSKKTGIETEDHKEEIEEEGLSLYDSLKLFAEPEQLDKDNQWYCSNCKDHKLAKKQMSVYKAPKYLIIHLKRFKSKGSRSFYSYGSHGKVSDLVRFPIKGLKLTNYVINHHKMEDYELETENGESQPTADSLIYDLYAVSNHSGGLGGGHYYAYAKNAYHKKWFCFNDSSVREMNESEVVSAGAYCLFYQRREPNMDQNVSFKILKVKKEEKKEKKEEEPGSREGLDEVGCAPSVTRNERISNHAS